MKKQIILYLPLLLLLLMVASCADSYTNDCTRILEECADLGVTEWEGELQFKNTPTRFESIKPGPRIIFYSGKAYLKAGVKLDDLSGVRIEAVPLARTISVTLPDPTIIDYKLEPKDVNREYMKVGFFRWKFTNDEKLAIRQRAEAELLQQTRGENPRIPILEDAKKNARRDLTILLMRSGKYDHIVIKFSGDEKVL